MKEPSEMEAGTSSEIAQRLLASATTLGLAPVTNLAPQSAQQQPLPQSRRRFAAAQCTQICIVISVCIITLMFHFITKDEKVGEALTSVMKSYETFLKSGVKTTPHEVSKTFT